MVVNTAVKVTADKVACLGDPLATTRKAGARNRHGKIILHRKPGILCLDVIGNALHPLPHPRVLNGDQLGIPLTARYGVNGHVLAKFLLIPFATMLAITSMRPERHIKEQTVKCEIIQHLVDLPENERMIVGVIQTAKTVTRLRCGAECHTAVRHLGLILAARLAV